MDKTFRRYPIGIQGLEDLRNSNCVYIYKTDLPPSIFKVYFLSRPRRFGKSLLVSMLEAYFLGKKLLPMTCPRAIGTGLDGRSCVAY